MYRKLTKIIFNRKLSAILLLGLSSGLPFALVASTLQAWFTKAGVSLMLIGILSLAKVPYTWKFLWSPLMDRFIPPLFGRRRGWLILTQIGLTLSIALLILFTPSHHPYIIFSLAVLIALLSSSQDITYNAFMVDVAEDDDRGAIAALSTIGWRFGIVISGAIALITAQHIGWKPTLLMISACMLIGLFTTLFLAKEPDSDHDLKMHHNFYRDLIRPFGEFFIRKKWYIGITLIFVIIFYKMGDAFTLSLNTTFILRYLHFSLTDLGTIGKFGATVIAISGALIGGVLMTRMRLLTALISFGLLQAISNLGYMLLAHIGHNINWLIGVTFFEYFTGALGTIAFTALIMTLCNKKYSASQFALFTAVAAFAQTYLGPVAALIVEHVGWQTFYFWSFITGLPGIFLLIPVRKYLVAPE